MSRTCGVTFALAVALFFPFPNRLVAPGYLSLPDIHVPSIRQIAAELPPPWNERSLNAWYETQMNAIEGYRYVDFIQRFARSIFFRFLTR